MATEKDKKATQERLLKAVGEIIEERGIEFVRVNAVAEKAGVSKILIYRYFGSPEEMIASYIMRHDYWVNVPTALPDKENLNEFIKNIFHDQIRRLREDKLMIRLLRWELSAATPLVDEIRREREKNGIQLIQLVSGAYALPYEQVQFLATIISTSVSYLAMFADRSEVYNGIEIGKDSGWQKFEEGIDSLIDQWIPKPKKIRFFK